MSAAVSTSGSVSGSPLDHGVFIAWELAALTCGAVIVAASRMALFATPVPRRWLTAALAMATVVTAGMLLIALATGIYTVALQIDAPHLAASLTGPLQISTTVAALLVELAVMAVASTLALTATSRGWQALGRHGTAAA